MASSVTQKEATPVRFGVAGLGGYAQSIADVLLESNTKLGPQVVQFIAAGDPAHASFGERAKLLKSRGVEILPSYDAVLARKDIDAVWLPVPIHLHRPFTEQAFATGRPVMCEKPPAGCIEDLDAMARASAAAKLPLLFGYQDIYDPSMLVLKRKLLAGVIGKVTSLSIAAAWPRDSVYYARNDWAGKLRRGDHWVMDSIITNALAHPVNLALYLLGNTNASAAAPVELEGELYRVNPIENFDTVALRAKLDTGSTLLVAMSHATRNEWGPEFTIVGNNGSARMVRGSIQILKPDGTVIETIERSKSNRVDMVRLTCAHFRGVPSEQLDGAVATPAVVRPHLVLCNALSETVPVRIVDEAHVDSATIRPGGKLRFIRDIEPMLRECASKLKLFSELGAAWASAPRKSKGSLLDYTHFAGPASA
ncbi:MAG: Gfo/Idh/MocA family oxidoreductase [Tepidisphaeraceae bacterium]